MSKKNPVRLFAYTSLETGGVYVPNEAQTHYLKDVMRMELHNSVFLFDGKNGEFESHICEISKKSLTLKVDRKTSDFQKSPDIWLLFAPLKKENTDIVVQKAVELGVSKIIPVQTEYTSNANIKIERIRAQTVEAAEQCRRQDIPTIENLISFHDLLKNWPQKRKLVYLNETGDGRSFQSMSSEMKEPVAFLIGPEGGFAKKELEILKSLPYTVNITLGKRILRAETATIAAISCWQAFCGDWK